MTPAPRLQFYSRSLERSLNAFRALAEYSSVNIIGRSKLHCVAMMPMSVLNAEKSSSSKTLAATAFSA